MTPSSSKSSHWFLFFSFKWYFASLIEHSWGFSWLQGLHSCGFPLVFSSVLILDFSLSACHLTLVNWFNLRFLFFFFAFLFDVHFLGNFVHSHGFIHQYIQISLYGQIPKIWFVSLYLFLLTFLFLIFNMVNINR